MQTLQASPIRTSFYQITVCALEKRPFYEALFLESARGGRGAEAHE